MFIKQHQQLLSKYKLTNKPTKYENIFEDKLKQFNIKYIKQKGFLKEANTCYIADFYLPKPFKIIIEIDGKYHQDRKEYDKQRDEYFMFKRGIKTVRFSNNEVECLSLEQIKDRVFNGK